MRNKQTKRADKFYSAPQCDEKFRKRPRVKHGCHITALIMSKHCRENALLTQGVLALLCVEISNYKTTYAIQLNQSHLQFQTRSISGNVLFKVMAAVVRLKRRCDEEPLEAVVLACKRKKIESDLGSTNNETPFQTVLKFAGTIKNQVNTLSIPLCQG